MDTYVCALGVLRGMCAYLCVCAGVLRGMSEYLWVCAGGVEWDVYILMGVHWGCFGGCAHSHECTLGVSRWMCTSLWVYVERYEVGVYVTIGGFKADVYVAMVVCWGFRSGCVCSYGYALGVSR